MQSDYHIEDLVYQTGDLVVYRARNKNGIPHAVSRIKFPYEILSGLEEGRFQEAYEELLNFTDPAIRNVVDGGQDPVDHFPWVATKWWKGAILSKKREEAPLTEEELLRIRTSAESLIHKFGDRAAALSFKPQSIIISRSADGVPLDTFAIDYFAWFRDWSLGHPPGGNRDPQRELEKMMESLQNRVAPSPQAIQRPELLAPGQAKAESPLVLTPASAATVAPSAQVTLPSSSSGGGLKAVFIITLLLGLVGGGLWWIKNQPPSADPQAATTPGDDEEKKTANKEPEPPKIASESPDKTPPTIPPPDPTPPRVRPMESRRPSEGEILEVEDDNLIALQRSVGKWIYVKSEVDKMDGDQTIRLKESPLKATLKRGSVSLDPGTKVRLVGILESPTHLEVPDNTDVEVLEEMDILPRKDIYTAADEKQLRTMAGQKVTVAAEVMGFKTSNSGKTYYLLLNDAKPEFAFSISASFGDSSELGQDYLKSLIGKTVKVSGSLKVDDIGGRMHIGFKYRSNLEISE